MTVAIVVTRGRACLSYKSLHLIVKHDALAVCDTAGVSQQSMQHIADAKIMHTPGACLVEELLGRRGEWGVSIYACQTIHRKP